MAKTLEFTEGEPWLWRFAEPRLTIDGVEYEDSEAYYQEHKPAAGDWSETANEQRSEVMCTALNAKFAASGEARALLVASHPHRLLSTPLRRPQPRLDLRELQRLCHARRPVLQRPRLEHTQLGRQGLRHGLLQEGRSICCQLLNAHLPP
jgi:hypothetical protein